jgi:hypothetical protein
MLKLANDIPHINSYIESIEIIFRKTKTQNPGSLHGLPGFSRCRRAGAE